MWEKCCGLLSIGNHKGGYSDGRVGLWEKFEVFSNSNELVQIYETVYIEVELTQLLYFARSVPMGDLRLLVGLRHGTNAQAFLDYFGLTQA